MESSPETRDRGRPGIPGRALHDAGKHADSVKKAQEAAAAINLQLKMKQ
jgi:hypothetical protein